jgi:solute carrier family 35 protein E1
MSSKGEASKQQSTQTSPSSSTAKLSTIGLIAIFSLWYAANAFYNVYNGFCKKDMTLPFVNASAQLAVGLVYAWPLWFLGIRKTPKLTFLDIVSIFPIVILNTIGHVCAVKAMFEKGGASFTHVIKASEPVVSVILGAIINFDFPYPLTFLSLLPITYGVVYASTLGDISIEKMSKELTTNAAIFAMASNVAFALRSIMR